MVGITVAAASAVAAVEVGRARVLFDKALSGCGGEETTNAIVVDAFLWRRATHSGSIYEYMTVNGGGDGGDD